MAENPYKKALSAIKNYWERIAESEEENVMGGGPACLSELSDWLHELLEKDCPKSLFFNENELKIDKIYPKVFFDKNFPEFITTELQTILPDAPEVKAILPLLVTGYIMSRRRSSVESQRDNNTTKLFVALKNGLEDEIYEYKENCEPYFQINSWENIFSEVTYTQMSKSRMKKSLSYFGMANLFLFLVYKMKEFCNLTLSCQLFEEFTGYLGLFDCYFPRLNDELLLSTEDDPLKIEISLYLEKLYGDRAPDDEDDRLDRYIVFVLDMLKKRECEKRGVDELSDEYLGKIVGHIKSCTALWLYANLRSEAKEYALRRCRT